MAFPNSINAPWPVLAGRRWLKMGLKFFSCSIVLLTCASRARKSLPYAYNYIWIRNLHIDSYQMRTSATIQSWNPGTTHEIALWSMPKGEDFPPLGFFVDLNIQFTSFLDNPTSHEYTKLLRHWKGWLTILGLAPDSVPLDFYCQMFSWYFERSIGLAADNEWT